MQESSKNKSRGRSKGISRDKSRERSLDRSRDRSQERMRKRMKERSRNRSRDRSQDKARDRSKENFRTLTDKSKKSNNRNDNPQNKTSKTGEVENVNPNSAKSVQSGDEDETPRKKAKTYDIELITTRTGGAYIPPAKLRMMQAQITDKSSPAYQRLSWEALRKSINGLINKVNVSNIGIIVRELFRVNIIRGRGLLTRSVMQAQAASPTFTHVYAAFVAIINTKFPQVGELILRRIIIQFRRGFQRSNKSQCLSATRFIGHLVNQQVAHEILALEILMLLLESPTDDAVEVGVGFLKECGMKLAELSPRGVHGIFERLRSILHEGNLDKRVQYMIEVMHAIRKDGFKDHPSVVSELDLVEEDDQFTHSIALDDSISGDDLLNVFNFDPNFQENEEKYKLLKRTILEEESSDEENSKSGEGESEEEEEKEEEEDANKVIVDNTETNLVSLRRTIYLTIQSSLDFEECAHKLLKMELKPGQEVELCHMILDCCAQQRTYEKFYGLLAQRFCQLNKMYVTPFEQIFVDSYDTIHRLETNKLRNVAKFFSHLLYTDAINWMVLAHIKLNEEDTTSSSRIFIKILFQELSEYMGLPRLNERLKDPTLQEAFEGLFPRDNPRNTRFAINFFTSIGLGGLTDELREHLKSQPKPAVVLPPPIDASAHAKSKESSSDESSKESNSNESSDENTSEDSESSTGSEESVEEVPVKKHHSKSKKKDRRKSSRRKSPEVVKTKRKSSKGAQRKEIKTRDSKKYEQVEELHHHHSQKSHFKNKHRKRKDK